MAICKNIECKKKFDKIRANQLVCSYSCASAYTKQLRDKKEKKEWTARKKKVAEELKTNSDHRKELQILVNKFIRLRDKDKGCISCGQSLNTKFDAGHFRSVGSCPELRFNEENIHGQCVYCNQHLHGNLIQYRKRLIDRIGLEKVYYLESNHEPKKYSILELIEMKVIYKSKIKSIE